MHLLLPRWSHKCSRQGFGNDGRGKDFKEAAKQSPSCVFILFFFRKVIIVQFHSFTSVHSVAVVLNSEESKAIDICK